MKKFLSLVLALVMTMSLVTISAGAKDYTDASEITYKEAVDVMSELKIIDGYTDGSFNPDATLTRGAAAKIICNLILGPTTAAALKADAAPFVDVPANHTFAGYIAYCAQQGIINGYNDGTFRPAAGLTGYAFMKMLLGALGYDAITEAYVGANWSIQVAKQALAIGLDDGNDDFNGVEIVNREEALLYAFNTMKATMVEYNAKTEVTTGNAVVTISGGRMDVENKVADDYRVTNRDDKMQFVEKYFTKVELDDSTTDIFGRWTNTWKNGKKTIGTYVKTPDALYHADVNEKTIYADLDLDEAYDFEVMVDGEINVEADLFEVTKKGTDKVSGATDGIVGNGSDIYVYLNDDADEGRIVVINTYLAKVADDYDDKNETLDIEYIDEDDKIAGLNYVDDWTGAVLSSDDWADLDTYADGDYVLITLASDLDDEGDEITVVKSLKKAEATKATVTEYVHTESVTADGEEYKYSAASMHNGENGETYAYTLKNEYDLYLDEEGNVLYATGESAADKYVYVVEFSKHSTSSRAAVEAYAYFLDGTEAELKIAKVDDEKVSASDLDSDNVLTVTDKDDVVVNTYDLDNDGGEWFTYTEKDGKYNLKKVTAQTYEKGAGDNVDSDDNNWVVNYKKFHTEIANEAGEYDGTSKTNFIIIDEDGDVKVYTGIRKVPEILAGEDTIINVNFKNEYAKNVFIDLQDGEMGSSDLSDDIIFLLSYEKQGNDADDDEYYRYKALKNGEKTTVKYDKDILKAVEGTAYSVIGTLWTDVEYTSKNYAEDANMVDGPVAMDRDDLSYAEIDGEALAEDGMTIEIGTGYIEYNEDGEPVEVEGSNDYFMAEDYTIYLIEETAKSTEEKPVYDYDTYTIKQLKRAYGKGEFEVAGAEVYGILNADNEYTALYIVLA